MGVSLAERLREDSEESEDELVVFEEDEIEIVREGEYVVVGGGDGGEVEEEEEDEEEGGEHEECGCGGEDDRAGELLCFLMKLQATAMESLGGGHEVAGEEDVEFDPKLYVDLPLKGSLQVTAAAFQALPRGTAGFVEPDTLKEFLKEYFYEAGSDLVPYTPSDHVANPEGFLPRVQNAAARAWGLKVHSLWPSLTRLVSPEVERQPDRHTLLPLQHPFVVPGERFREVYYWDSYWVIRGLLASKMTETAAGMVDNFLGIVDTHGFIPNGSRTYYENRSQPPFLGRMVRAVFFATGDLSLANRALPLLLEEYKFWTRDPYQVVVRDVQGREHKLSRYSALWDKPRPECSTIDKSIAGGFSKSKKKQIFRNIATAAESGWDFSSRWMGDGETLSSMKTASIIPVDLNAFLLQMECDIAFFARAVNNDKLFKHFTWAAEARRRAFDAILWNESMGQWLDYWLPLQKPADARKNVYSWDSSMSNRNIYASNFVPLWCSIFQPGDSRIDQVVEALSSSDLVQPGGIATSLKETGQQWDFPNAWAPLQHMIIEGLVMSGSRKAIAMAQTISHSWLRSNYMSFQRTGHMVEKYDARYCGKVGGGGEYTIQTGFGWSNGVVLILLNDYGWPEDLPLDCGYAT
ncbi:hypothetical protein KC19_12G152100 [Ceratodon purpureus]|uniref:Trehalase n=1 Tax=Ceratodon purpureus TaxID=3225 RepID=A0A8T0GBJ2_CERPU|nr:hypothetical protein KC19_12G152100 [Ceratodon purpureus]